MNSVSKDKVPIGKRGGRREGAGRKAADGVRPVTRINITLDAATIEQARKIGGGNLSLGLRIAVSKVKNL